MNLLLFTEQIFSKWKIVRQFLIIKIKIKSKPTSKSNSTILLHLNFKFAKLVGSDSCELGFFMIILLTFLKLA